MSQSETRPEETTSRHLVREEQEAPARTGPGKPFVLIGVAAGIAFLLVLVVLFALDGGESPAPAAAGRDQQAQQAFDQKRQTRAEAKANSLEDEPFVDKGRPAAGITEEWEQQLRRAQTVSPPAEEPSEEEIRRRVNRLSLVEQVMAQRQATAADGEVGGVPGRYAYDTRENQLNERKYEEDRRERAKEQERQPMFVYSRSYRKAAYFAGEEPPERTGGQEQPGREEAPAAPGNAALADKSPDKRPSAPDPLRFGTLPPIQVAEGEFVDAVLTHRIVSDTEESPVICAVSRDLIDNSGRYVVIPAGTRIVGRSQVVNYMGAARLFIGFHRLILPNGLAADFPDSARLSALDATGALGAASKVNRHWLLQFGAAIFVGVLEGLGAAAQQHTDPYSGQAYVIEDTTDNFEKILNVVMQRYSNIVPTITVGPGYPMKIFLTEDVRISPFARVTERGYARR